MKYAKYIVNADEEILHLFRNMNYLLLINKKLMNFFVYLTYKFVLISKINLKFKILILSKI